LTRVIFFYESTTKNPADKYLVIKAPVPFTFNFYDLRGRRLFTDKLPDGTGERSKTFDMNMIQYPTWVNVETIATCSGKNFGFYRLQLLGGDVYKILLEEDTFPLYAQGWGMMLKDGMPTPIRWRDYPPPDDGSDVSTRGDWFW